MLPEPTRTYTDILAKNMFTGVASPSKLTEDRSQVLAVVKLTAVWNAGRRWEATIYDQGKGGDEKRVTERLLTDFTIADKYNNALVDGKVVRLGEQGMIFEADKKYYRWLLGDFLGTAMETPLEVERTQGAGRQGHAALFRRAGASATTISVAPFGTPWSADSLTGRRRPQGRGGYAPARRPWNSLQESGSRLPKE